MNNKGQVHAYDTDRKRLAPIIERLKRAGTRNVQVHDRLETLKPLLAASFDRVLVDAPCTGTGTWRRRPDTKWRLTQKNLEERLSPAARGARPAAAPFVRPGGHLDLRHLFGAAARKTRRRSTASARTIPEFEILSGADAWADLFGADKPQPWSADMKTVTLTPASTDTDGFFFCLMGRKS